MNKYFRLVTFIVVLSTVMLMSCSSAAKTALPQSAASKSTGAYPAITITYSGTFVGQTASGFLKLLVDLTIENKGYESFSTSPANFSVSVDNYSYSAAESDLQTVNLPDGDKIGGKLVFQVPPVAATTRVGYRMEHSGQELTNIQWAKLTETPLSVADTGPQVIITYSDSYMWIKETRSLYLLVKMTIQNKGYESFNTSPEFFTLVMGNILGETGRRPPISFDGAISDEKDGAYSDLRSYDLQNGGKLSGTLAFQVPTDIQRATERYRLEYSGVRQYAITWQWQPPQP